MAMTLIAIYVVGIFYHSVLWCHQAVRWGEPWSPVASLKAFVLTMAWPLVQLWLWLRANWEQWRS